MAILIFRGFLWVYMHTEDLIQAATEENEKLANSSGECTSNCSDRVERTWENLST